MEGKNKPISQGYVCSSSLSPSQTREESSMHDGLGLCMLLDFVDHLTYPTQQKLDLCHEPSKSYYLPLPPWELILLQQRKESDLTIKIYWTNAIHT
jgi:hypothetical protein